MHGVGLPQGDTGLRGHLPNKNAHFSCFNWEKLNHLPEVAPWAAEQEPTSSACMDSF